jgi:ribosomal protein L6P/L9E
MEINADTQEVPEGLTEQQATDELLKRWSSNDEEPEAEPDEPEKEPQPEGDEEPTEEAEEAIPEDVEIDVGGAKFKAPKALEETFRQVEAKVKEIEAGATRKFQEAADLRKSVDTEKKAVAELQRVAHENAAILGDHAMVSRRLAAIEAIDIASTDEGALVRLNAEYNQLQAAKGRIEQQYQNNVLRMRDEESKAVRARQEHAEKLLSTHMKNWGPARQKELAEYAMSRGAPAEAISQITDAWMVQILDDAQYGRQMRDAKPELKRVIDPSKTLKPSGSGSKQSTSKAADAMAKAKKTGSIDDAVMALLARSKVRK